MNDKGLKIFQ